MFQVSWKAAFSVAVILLLLPAAFAAEYYVTPTGSPSGNGSMGAPWDLQTALLQPAQVQPGDTIWLRSGVYKGSFDSWLSGAPGLPIKVRQYPGDRATLDGAGNAWNAPALEVNGCWTWFQDLEIRNSSNRVFGSARPHGIEVYGPNIKLINLVIHDNGQGAGLWSQAPNLEAYGNLFYNNGWQASDRGHGHNIYTQNQTGSKLINNNILLAPFSFNVHVYSTNVPIDNYQIGNNIVFNGPFLVGGQMDGHNITIDGNYFYASNPTFGYGATNNDRLTLTNNYVAGVTAARWWSNARISGNTFYPLNQTGQDLALSVTLKTGGSTADYVIDGNTYNQGTMRAGWDFSMIDSTAHNYLYSMWTGQTGWDKSSNYITSPPKGQKIVLQPNQYDADRANLAIYNWDKTSTVTVDLSSLGFKSGDIIDIRNAQNYFAEMMTITYSGSPVTIPMTGWTAALPVGLTAPLYPVTFPQFGAFVIVRRPVVPINIAVTPGQLTLMPGQRQQFSAKVSGSSNNNVTWSISPRVGSITASGYYVAPSTLASSVTVKVIATSVADPTRSSAASVDLEAVSVAITPNSIALTDGKTQQFVADLTGTYNTAVKWSIVQGLGKISTSGLYTAPTGITVNSTVTVKAVSYADPTKFALATVYLTPNIPVSMSITPTFVSMKPGQTQQFNVTVYGPADKSITWSLSPPVGTISPTGLYTAPCVMTRTVVTITATSNANRTRSVSAVASVNAFIGVMVSPDPITIKAGQTLQLSALVNGLNSTSVNWTIPATAPGTISGTGLYVAPPAVAGPTVVTVSATSVVDPTKYGSATVTVIP